MDVKIEKLFGKESRFRINRTQRLVIETAHGFVEIRADMDKCHPNNVQIVTTVPEDLSVRKGDKDALTLRAKFHNENLAPIARIFELKEDGRGKPILRPLEALHVGD